MKTYNDVYFQTRQALRDEGIAGYTLEARLLVGAAAGKTKEQLVRDGGLYTNDGFEDKVKELTARRIEGEPVAYITGEWEFFGLPMQVSPDVLIPRIDTEVLAQAAIDWLDERGQGMRVLDLCSGSGCVGIAIAANANDCRVVLVDDSAAALRQSRVNIINNKLTRYINCVEADALGQPPMLLGTFDLIVCNPPYIPTADIDGLDVSVRSYEPMRALDGGKDGLVFYRAVTKKWKSILRPGGAIMFECGVGQADDVAGIMQAAGFGDIKIIKDTLGIDRVVSGKLQEG